MSRHHYPPAFLRYLKARLWNLARPSFWITAIFLSALGLVIKEYWMHPDVLTQQQKQPVASTQPADSISHQDDKNITADIDTSPVLYGKSGQTSLPLPRTATLRQNTRTSNSKDTSDNSNQSQIASNAQSNSGKQETTNPPSALSWENPFLVQADNLLQGNSFQSNYFQSNNSQTNSQTNKLLGVYSSILDYAPPRGTSTSTPVGVASGNQTNYTQPVTSVNPAQTTLNQSTNLTASLDSNTNSVDVRQSVPTYNVPVAQSVPIYNVPVGVGQSLPTYNYSIPSQILPPANRVTRDPNNPGIVTGYTQPQITNQQPNPYSTFNPYSYLQYSYIQYRTNRNAFLNRYQNLSSGQVSPSTIPTATVVSPNMYTTPTYTTPYYTQTPGQGMVVTPYNPVVTNSYNSPTLQQPTQGYQYNLSSPIPNYGQYPNTRRINGYMYP